MKIIISVRYNDGINNPSADMEVPADVYAGDLAQWLAQALKIDTPESEFVYQHTLKAPFLDDRILSTTDTLASMGLWTGSTLILESQRIRKKPRTKHVPSVAQKHIQAFFESETTKYPVGFAGVWIGRSTPHTYPEILKTLIDLKDEKDSDAVSRQHARIIIKDKEYYLIAARKNVSRTFVNGENPKPNVEHLLHDGDEVKFGNVLLKFNLRKTK